MTLWSATGACPFRWDSSPPSTYQYAEVIGQTEFTEAVAASGGTANVIPPLGVELIEAPLRRARGP